MWRLQQLKKPMRICATNENEMGEMSAILNKNMKKKFSFYFRRRLQASSEDGQGARLYKKKH